MKEILGCGMSTINDWFKRFCKRYSDAYYAKYVYIPTGAALNEVEKVYKWMGFPGCVGSMDVTHVHWGNCPSELRHHCIGRYGYPTLGFNLYVRTIVVFNIFLNLSMVLPMTSPSLTMITILVVSCCVKQIRIACFVPTIVWGILHTGEVRIL